MHSAIKISYEGKRGCGYRSVGGIYMVNDGGGGFPCGRLPIPLDICQCCGQGFKPHRSFGWVNLAMLANASPSGCRNPVAECLFCPFHKMVDNLERCGMIWIGEKFYSPEEFDLEALKMGISRRISSVPNDFVLGEHYIALAHKKAIKVPLALGDEPEYRPGVFKIFKPTAIEIIVDGSESDEVIEGYLKRGLTPVLVRQIKEDEVDHADLSKS